MEHFQKETLLFYINAIHDGGAERVIIEVAHGLSQMGYRSILVTSFVDENWEYPIPDGVERVSIEQRERRDSFVVRNIRRVYALRQLCKKYKPAVLVSFMDESNVRALIATMGLPVKNIISVRADPAQLYDGFCKSLLARYLLPRADGCVFQTENAMHWFPESLQRKSQVILNPVKPAFFQMQRVHNPKHIVAIGRLDKFKNFGLLLDAFSQLAFKYPQEKLLIFGQGVLRDELQRKINALHLEGRAFLMGATDDVPGVLATARLFVLSSDSEGMPNALMEAMAVGVPVIATDCPSGGVRSLIEDGVNGLLVPMGDKERLADAMDKVLTDDSLSERLGDYARQSAVARFNPMKVMHEWENFLRQVIGNTMLRYTPD